MQDNSYLKQLKKTPEELTEYAVISINDQLTNSRIRSCQATRLGEPSRYHSREFLILAIALFHLVLNLIWALKEVHYSTILDISGLAKLFLRADKARLAGAKPDFHSLSVALTEILEGIILNAWEVECGEDLEDFVKSNPSPEKLIEIAHRIIRNHATPTPTFTPAYVPRKSKNSDTASTNPPSSEPSAESKKADHVRENVIRLTRDLLLVIELVAAIKDGDFGRVEDVLPDLAFVFRGSGSNNYSTEILHLIHNFKYVWSEEFAEVVRNTLIINISGLPGHGMGIDLNIEHLIRYLKGLFAAKGLYSKWDRAGNISASINIIMALKRRVSKSLRLTYQGSSHSKSNSPDLVERIRLDAKENQLHTHIAGRTSVPLRPDLRAVGRQKIETSSLAAFNAKLCLIASGSALAPLDNEVDELRAPEFEMEGVAENLTES